MQSTRRHIQSYMNDGSPNPAPSPRINVTKEPFCADYYMDWMLCHIATLLNVQASDYTGTNDRNYVVKGQVLSFLENMMIEFNKKNYIVLLIRYF